MMHGFVRYFLLAMVMAISAKTIPQSKEEALKHVPTFGEQHQNDATMHQTDKDANQLRYFQKKLIAENSATTGGLSNEPFAGYESCKIQVSSTENADKFTPFKGIVIGYNYVCITKGAWQWESGKLKYFFTSKLTGSIKAKIKYFKFDNLEISLNLKL